jgi:hypothetical protein
MMATIVGCKCATLLVVRRFDQRSEIRLLHLACLHDDPAVPTAAVGDRQSLAKCYKS